MCGFVACEERFWWLSWDRPFESKLIKIVYEKISAIKYLVAKKSGAALKVPYKGKEDPQSFGVLVIICSS